jgi:hypothetical protein
MQRTELKAVDFVIANLKKEGWTVKKRKEGKWIGFDLLAMKGDDLRFIEVKGTAKPFAIPDMAETEFTRNLTLIATHLYVVGNVRENPKLYIIPRRCFKKGYFSIKRTVHFKRKFNDEIQKCAKPN